MVLAELIVVLKKNKTEEMDSFVFNEILRLHLNICPNNNKNDVSDDCGNDFCLHLVFLSLLICAACSRTVHVLLADCCGCLLNCNIKKLLNRRSEQLPC